MSEQVRSDRSGALLVLLVVAAALVALLGVYRVWYNYQTIGLGYQLAEETRRHRRLFGQNRALRLELESLERGRILELQASSTLRFPEPGDMVLVPNTSRTTE